MKLKVVVGSTNKVKIDSVIESFNGVFPNELWEVIGVDVDSGVSDQPLSEEETIEGARNRVLRCKELRAADYYVGIEGGLMKSTSGWMECGWIVIRNNKGVEGIASSPKIMISSKVYGFLSRDNNTLTDVCEKYFKVKNAGSKTGYFGLMTNGYVDRKRAYIDGVSFALSRFAHPELFEL